MEFLFWVCVGSGKSSYSVLLEMYRYGWHIYVYDMCDSCYCRMVWSESVVGKDDRNISVFCNNIISFFNAKGEYDISQVGNRNDIFVYTEHMEHLV